MRLGIIGCGKMGSALVKGIVNAGIVAGDEVTVHDAWKPSIEALQDALPGVNAAASNIEVVEASEVVLLCTKPQDMLALLKEVGTSAHPVLLISIAAGVTLADLEAPLSEAQRVIRVMPNTPALIQEGASAYALGTRNLPGDANMVESLLGAVGKVSCVPEKLLDAVTGLSGSGPAYVYTIIEALSDGGVLMGLPKTQAVELAAQTVLGAAKMVLETGEHPAVLRDQVTSPGGTTIAGLAEMERHGLRKALIEGVRKATERSVELGN